MDAFKRQQHHNLGIGGIKCFCCNNIARKGRDRVDRSLNRAARARIKALTKKQISNE